MKKLFPNWKWTWRTPLKFVMPAVLLIILICHRNLYFGESALKNVKATVPLENQRPAVFFLLIVLILLWCLWIFHASYGKHAGDPRLSALRSPVSVPVNLALVFGNAVLSFYLIELINNYYLLNMKTRYLVLGWMINFVLYLIAVFLLNSLKIGMITGNIFFIVWGIVNYFVQQFRGIPFQWIDFGSMRTAMSVSGNYRYTPTWQMITGVILVFVVCSFWSKRRTTLLFMNRAGKIGSRASAIILLFAFWVVIFRTDFLSGTGIWLRDWQPWYTYRLFGMESGFLAFAKASFPEAPEDYSAAEVKSIIDDYRAGGYSADVQCSEIPENLIVIMNESFSDLSIYPGFETDEDVIPGYHALTKDTQKGKLLVSVKGGTTANTEYEFLTGNSCVLSPTTVVYNSFIKHDQYSLAGILKEQGYEAVAIHPYGQHGWNRDVVYPRMGFERFLNTSNAFKNAAKVRSFVSDDADYEEILRQIANKEKGQKLFIFNITMQNHSQYKNEQFKSTVDIKGFHGKNEGQAEQYCSLLKLSDEATIDLLDRLRKLDQKTMVLFFGDHQPEIGDDFWEYCQGNDIEKWNFDEQQRAFETCFFVWANYDIPEADGLFLSANYLSPYLLSLTGLDRSDYEDYLLQMREKIPAMNSFGYYGSDGKQHEWDEKETDPAAWEKLRQYKCLIYNELTGGASRDASFFGLKDAAGQ